MIGGDGRNVASLAIFSSCLTIAACLLIIPLIQQQLDSWSARVMAQMVEFKAITDDSWREMMTVRQELRRRRQSGLTLDFLSELDHDIFEEFGEDGGTEDRFGFLPPLPRNDPHPFEPVPAPASDPFSGFGSPGSSFSSNRVQQAFEEPQFSRNEDSSSLIGIQPGNPFQPTLPTRRPPFEEENPAGIPGFPGFQISQPRRFEGRRRRPGQRFETTERPTRRFNAQTRPNDRFDWRFEQTTLRPTKTTARPFNAQTRPNDRFDDWRFEQTTLRPTKTTARPFNAQTRPDDRFNWGVEQTTVRPIDPVPHFLPRTRQPDNRRFNPEVRATTQRATQQRFDPFTPEPIRATFPPREEPRRNQVDPRNDNRAFQQSQDPRIGRREQWRDDGNWRNTETAQVQQNNHYAVVEQRPVPYAAAPAVAPNSYQTAPPVPQQPRYRPVQSRKGKCNCPNLTCPPGPPGPPGIPGQDGSEGLTGADGQPGLPGPDVTPSVIEPPCMTCPAGKRGNVGPVGAQGKDGEVGTPGMPGMPGRNGFHGGMGGKGVPGAKGPPGVAGKKGQPGLDMLGGKGSPGEKGNVGAQGLPGMPGHPGQSVRNPGAPGEVGPKGSRGSPGADGTPGAHGPVGERGERGNDALYCQCPERGLRPYYQPEEQGEPYTIRR